MCSETQDTKTCSKCGTEKPLDDFYYRKDSGKHRNECKPCWQESQLVRKIGVDFECYQKILKAQKHKCAICGCHLESSRYTKFAVDHCHKTGKVRGLLCTQCNTALGLFKDSPKRLHSAISYLNNSSLSEDIV